MIRSYLALGFIILALSFCSELFAQATTDNIRMIRQQVQRINQIKNLKTRVLNGEEFSNHSTDGGGELTCYFAGHKLVKIVEWVGLSSWIEITEYYLQNGSLIFVYSRGKEFDYLSPSSTTTPRLTMQCRFYYATGKLIKSVLRGALRCKGTPEEEWSQDYLESFKHYKNIRLN